MSCGNARHSLIDNLVDSNSATTEHSGCKKPVAGERLLGVVMQERKAAADCTDDTDRERLFQASVSSAFIRGRIFAFDLCKIHVHPWHFLPVRRRARRTR